VRLFGYVGDELGGFFDVVSVSTPILRSGVALHHTNPMRSSHCSCFIVLRAEGGDRSSVDGFAVAEGWAEARALHAWAARGSLPVCNWWGGLRDAMR